MFKIKNTRVLIILICITLLFTAGLFRLVRLQIVEGKEYKEASDKKLYNIMPVKAPRGEILDRYGRVLATNRNGYSIRIVKTNISTNEFHKMLIGLIEIIERDGRNIETSLPVSDTAPFTFLFKGDTDEIKISNEKKWKSEMSLDENLTAEQVIDKLASRYEISDDYDIFSVRKLTGLLYEMKQRGFGGSMPYTLLTDVSTNILAQVKERQEDFSGVSIVEEPIRFYPEDSLATHILGYTGVIYKEEYEKLKGRNYGMNDIIGKQGAELAFEDFLKGSNGVSGYEKKIGGSLEEMGQSVAPVPGNNVMLTIDLDLQKQVEKSLENTIKQIASTGGSDNGADASSGAAVCLNVNTGEVLAIASYPTYNPETYNKDYNKLLENKDNPLFNRAIAGIYEPGSTFKMLTAVSALEEGVITPEQTILDEGIYKFYDDYQPACMEWKYGKTHGYVNVSKALEVSCNYFFFEAGRLTTIEKLDEYANRFGFGRTTGIEISGETKGIVAGKDYRKSINKPWYPGDTLQAAIGQSDNLFTPIQLANYVATLVNGGKRYNIHLLKSVRDPISGDVTFSKAPQIEEEINLKPSTIKAVMEGMRKVTEDGTASSVFKDYKISVGGKTGTAETSKGSNNGVFVSFAPFDNPEIAIAIVIEHGVHGVYAAPIAKDIIDQYFFKTIEEKIDPNDELLR